MSTWTGNPSATRDGTLKMRLWRAGGSAIISGTSYPLLQDARIRIRIPGVGPAGVDEEFQYTEISCKGDEDNLLDCSLK